jgi:xanthine/CO dehydrogenase XdhC/CoxF family maturation factor
MESAGDNEQILSQAAKWRGEGKGVALATVVSTWGSSPRPSGSKLVLADDGAFLGSVSGGCVEGAVIEEGQKSIKDGQPRLLSFGVTDERAWEVGLACGGKIDVYVEPVE